MPQLAATALVNAGVIGAGSAATAAAVISAAVVASSVAYSQSQQRRQRRAAADMASRGREFSIKTTDAPRSLIVGRASVPIERIVYLDTFGDRRERVVFVAAFGGHEIDAIEDIHFDGESIGALDGSGWVTGGKFANPRRRQTALDATWPPPGQIVAYLPHSEHMTTYDVVSVAVANHSDNAQDVLPSGIGGWVMAAVANPSNPSQSVPAVVAGNNSGAWAGQQVIITCRTEERRPLVRAVKFLGSDAGQTDSELIAMSAGTDTPWTSAHRGHGVPRVRFELVWDADVFGPTGFPDIRFIVRGAKVPSFTGGAPSWTQNAARNIAWFLTRPEGFNARPEDIDTTLAAAAQNACDETVPYGDGSQNQPRYQCDGLIDTEANPVDTLRDLLGSMVGRAVPVGGKWDIYAGVGQTPTYTLTDDDLAGGDELVVPTTAVAEMVNCVRGRFVNRDEGYIVNDAPPYESATYITEDGGAKRWLDVSLPFTTNVHAAQRIQRVQLHRARNALIWSSKYAFGAHAARAGMTVRAQHTEYGWHSLESGAGKRFEIEEHAKSMDGTVDLIMRETSPAIYDWSYNEAIDPDPTPNTAFPDPTYVEPLELVSIVSNSETYDVGSDGQKTPYALLTWNALPPDVAAEATRIEIEWKGAGELSYRQERLTPEQTSVKLRPVFGGMFISGSAVVVNGLGVSSSPAFFVHPVSTELPSTAQGIASGNMISNAGFDWGVDGFNWFGSGPNDSFRRWTGTPNFRVSRPSIGVLDQRPGSTGSMGVNTPLFDCEPGKRYLVMARIHSYRSRSWVAIAFANESHQHVGQVNSPYTTMQTSEPSSLDSFEFRHAFVTAPPTARKMLFQFGKLETQVGNASWAYIYQPMVCQVEGGDFIPLWSFGPVDRVAPAQMPSGAAVLVARVTPLGTINVGANNWGAVTSVTVPPFPVAHRLRITARWVGTRTVETSGEEVAIRVMNDIVRTTALIPPASTLPYSEERTTSVIVNRPADGAGVIVSMAARFFPAGFAGVTISGVELSVEFIAN